MRTGKRYSAYCLTQIKPTCCKGLLGFLYRLCWGAESQLKHDGLAVTWSYSGPTFLT